MALTSQVLLLFLLLLSFERRSFNNNILHANSNKCSIYTHICIYKSRKMAQTEENEWKKQLQEHIILLCLSFVYTDCKVFYFKVLTFIHAVFALW